MSCLSIQNVTRSQDLIYYSAARICSRMAKRELHSIQLNKKESELRDLLVEYANHVDSCNGPQENTTVLRITGGWVRDKLLGRECHDIDIAINNETGQKFAEKLQEYIVTNKGRLGLVARKVHTIEKNPEKSKHLETATTKLFDLDIDFVNLRSEEYTENSRVPTVKFGTPKEDADRRDATLNALFYNLNEQKVEDFTGRGISDLKLGILRTPLDPHKTFKDDPLRILRLVRFVCTFGFDVAEETLIGMSHEDVKSGLISKVSSERKGQEMEKALKGTDVIKGLKLLDQTKIEDEVFHVPDDYTVVGSIPKTNLSSSLDVLDCFLHLKTLGPYAEYILNDTQRRVTFLLSIILNKWQGVKLKPLKKAPVPATEVLIKFGIKLSGSYASRVSSITSNYVDVRSLADKDAQVSRKDLGLLVMSCGQNWIVDIMYALIKDTIETGGDLNKLSVKYLRLITQINELDLDKAWSAKPLLDGKAVQQLLESKSGPWMQEAMRKIIEYQFDNPSCSKDDVSHFLLAQKEQIISFKKNAY